MTRNPTLRKPNGQFAATNVGWDAVRRVVACEVSRGPFVIPRARLRTHTISSPGSFRHRVPRIDRNGAISGSTPLYGAEDPQRFAEGWNEPSVVLDFVTSDPKPRP